MSVLWERKLLGRMTNPQEISKIWENGLRAEVFVDTPVNEAVFSFSVDYWLRNAMQKAPTREVLEYEFPGAMIEWVAEESTLWLVNALQRRYATNQLQEILRDTSVTSVEDPLGTLKSVWNKAYSASETIAPRYDRMNVATSIEDRRRWYSEREENKGVGVTLGLPALDTHTNGLLPGELCAVGGFSSTGKTLYLVNAAVQARKQGHIPLLFTLEMNLRDILERIDALSSGVSYTRLSHGSLTHPEQRQLHESQEEFASLGPLYVERPGRGDRTVSNLVNRARQLGANYLLIDQLSFLDTERDYYGDKALTSKHGDLIFALKDEVARESVGAIPCMIAIQFNRASQNQESVRLDNFANSSVIEQTADFALGLSRNKEMRANRCMQLDILKARRSDTGSWLLRWELAERSRIEVIQENGS